MNVGWTFYVRLAAALVLVACLFLPLSTCTYRGQTQTIVPIEDIRPIAVVVAAFCWALLLLVAEAFRPRLSTSGLVLVSLQPPLAVASFYQIAIFILFNEPALGSYLSNAALAAIFIAATFEIVFRVRSRRRQKRAAPSAALA